MTKCGGCSLVLKDAWNLNEHLRLGHPQEPGWTVKCPLCPFAGKDAATMTSHVKTFHIQCPVCPFVGQGNEDVKKHVMSTHNSCSRCSFIGRDATSLAGHIQSQHRPATANPQQQQEQKPEQQPQPQQKDKEQQDTLKCPLCPFEGPKTALGGHIKGSHVKCPQCQFVGREQSDTRNHLLGVHKFQSCSQCDYYCEFKQSLKIHMNSKHKTMTKSRILPSGLTMWPWQRPHFQPM